MTAPEVLDLRPLALGHDQEASVCHWAQLTRRTAEYPSRRAQLALALLAGSALPTPDLVALMYRCDDCGRCRKHSILPQPPDLARALWPVRARLVEQGAVPEVNALRARLTQHGHLYGDLNAAWNSLGPSDAGAETLFVPDGAVLAIDPPSARAAIWAARCVAGSVALAPEVPDSGRALRELGLAAEADRTQAAARQCIVEGGFKHVLAGTPKEAASLAEVMAGLPVQVQYVGSALARAAREGRVRFRELGGERRRVVLHPSAALLQTPPACSLVTEWLGAWLGDDFCLEPDAAGTAWPAAVERPAIGLEPALAQQLARCRLDQLMVFMPGVILTCDPYSLRALHAAAPIGVAVMDLLVFAMHHFVESER